MKLLLRRNAAELLVVAVLAWVILLSWSYRAGFDYNWDLLNYHLYAGLAASQDRLAQDFFPASVQSYLNPYSFVLLYKLINSGAPAQFIGSVLVTLHTLNVVLIHAIAQHVLPASGQALLRWTATVLALLTPVLLIEVGTSFNDVIVSIPVLAALLLFLEERPVHHLCFILAGLLSGVAAGLKLTNAPFAVALAVTLVLVAPRWREALLRLVVHCVAAGVGFLASSGLWSWRLYQEFGSPFFPFFNALFEAPDFPAIDIKIFRFLPDSLSDALLLPIFMMVPVPNVYTEVMAPEGKLAFVIFLTVAAATRFQWTGFTSFKRDSAALRASLFFWLALPLWVWSSGNGRYALPLLLVAAPICVLLVARISASPRPRAYLLVTLLGVQGLSVVYGTDARWSEAPWRDSPWFAVDAPLRFMSVPALYLSLDTQPAAFLAAYAHPKSSFVSLVGLNPLSPDGPGGTRVLRLLQKHASRVYVLFPVYELDENNKPRMQRAAEYRSTVSPLGLEIQLDACEFVRVNGMPSRRRKTLPTGDITLDQEGPFSLFAYCPAFRKEEPFQYRAERHQMATVFALAEAKCPHFFRPAEMQIYAIGNEWHKRYIDTDAHLILTPTRAKVFGYRLKLESYSRTAGEALPLSFECPSRSGKRSKGNGDVDLQQSTAR